MRNIISLLLAIVLHAGTCYGADDEPFDKPGTYEKPLSAYDDGYNAIYLWLQREEHSEKSKLKTHGHYFYPLCIGDTTYPLQVSAFNTATSVVGTECRLGCDVNLKYSSGGKSWSGSATVNSFKNFDSKDATGFKQSTFMGRYITEPLVTLSEGSDQAQDLLNFKIFVVFHNMQATEMYVSDQSGVMGFGPQTKNDDVDKQSSILYKLRSEGLITQSMISYNITYKPDPNEHLDDSYIQLGPIATDIYEKATWLTTSTWDHWSVPVSFSFFRQNEKLFPFLEFNAAAIFDPQVDHLYVNQIEFQMLIKPVIEQIYGPAITCAEDECAFVGKDCPTAKKDHKQDVGFQFSLGPIDDPSKQTQIHVNLEDYLVDGKDVGQTDPICFIPIFVTNPGTNTDVFNTWFLGSMFLDRYFVINSMQNASRDKNVLPQIAIYDKWAKRGPAEEEKPETNFQTTKGHCFIPTGSKIEGTDWKNLGKGQSEKDCRHQCNLDEKCAGYEYQGNELQCAHWFGDVKGDSSDGASCYVKDKAPAEPEKVPESSGLGTFWAIFLTLLFLGGAAALAKLYGKQALEYGQKRWDAYRQGQGAGAFDASGDIYQSDPSTAPMMNEENAAPVPPAPPSAITTGEDQPGTRLNFDN